MTDTINSNTTNMASTNTPEDQPGGLLFKLPPEVRLQIYKLMFPPDKIDLFSVDDHLDVDRNPHLVAGGCVAILATCRAIHNEAQPVLYGNTRFDISSCPIHDCLSMWRRREKEGRSCEWALSDSDLLGSDIFSNLQQARSISLDISLEKGQMYTKSWIDWVSEEISGLLRLQKLHITFRAPPLEILSETFQAEADRTMSLLGNIKSECHITAAMDLSLGPTGFKSASYYAMLDKLGG